MVHPNQKQTHDPPRGQFNVVDLKTGDLLESGDIGDCFEFCLRQWPKGGKCEGSPIIHDGTRPVAAVLPAGVDLKIERHDLRHKTPEEAAHSIIDKITGVHKKNAASQQAAAQEAVAIVQDMRSAMFGLLDYLYDGWRQDDLPEFYTDKAKETYGRAIAALARSYGVPADAAEQIKEIARQQGG